MKRREVQVRLGVLGQGAGYAAPDKTLLCASL